MRIFVTGINGFIGRHLLSAMLAETDWEISGIDVASESVEPYEGNRRFTFRKGDIFQDDKFIESEVVKADAVLPLAGIAKPAYYIKKPLWTFELDFEQNLKIVRLCAKHGKRVIFPSTSEVYGMSGGGLKEDESPLTVGPVSKTRWIYSCSKQMMDRMIFAYGQEQDMPFSIFRPFNWVGPGLDTFADAAERRARLVTQMIYDMTRRREITLVNGGSQRRCFTWIGDGVDGLLAVIRSEKGRADGEIFNIGNPANNCSVRETAELLIDEAKKFPQFRAAAEAARLISVPGEEYYGANYDDMQYRAPSVEKMERRLGWKPKTDMRGLLRRTLSYFAEKEAA